MNRTIYILTIFIGFSLNAVAQAPSQGEGGLDRQVEVSRDYRPDIERSLKLNIPPELSDTTTLRPEFNYDLAPTPWVTGFGVEAISPIRIDASGLTPLRPFYAEVGGGFPGNSIANLGLTTTGRGINSAGFTLRHYGQYADIKNDLGIKRRALTTTNNASLFGKVGVGRYEFRGRFELEHDVWSRYGQFAHVNRQWNSYGGQSPMQSYTTPSGVLSIGTPFADFSYFNFRVGGSGYHISDRMNRAEAGYGAFLELARAFRGPKLGLLMALDGSSGSKDIDYYGNMIARAVATYEISTGVFRMRLSPGVAYENPEISGEKWWFLPSAEVSVDFADGYLVPFASIETTLTDNSLRNITRNNPFYTSYDLDAPATIHYSIRGGLAGSVSGFFSWRLYAGVDRIKRALYFVSINKEGDTSGFDAMTDQVEAVTFGGELTGRVPLGISMSLSGQYFDYRATDRDHAYDRPEYEGAFRISYAWQDRLTVAVGAGIYGKRWFAERIDADPGQFNYIHTETRAKAAFDLSFSARYTITENLGVFLEGNNLTGSKLYRWNHYRDVGARVSAGVVLKF